MDARLNYVGGLIVQRTGRNAQNVVPERPRFTALLNRIVPPYLFHDDERYPQPDTCATTTFRRVERLEIRLYQPYAQPE
jgi:hypothetical protein